MILGRNVFFLLLLVLFIGPFITWKLVWLAASKKTTGVVYFMGHTLEGLGNITRHLVVRFSAGRDSITFNAADDLGFRVGDLVPIRYQEDDPSDARIDTHFCIWGDTEVNCIFPFVVLLVLYLTPEFLSPLIPRRSKIRIGKKTFIRIIPATRGN